ncbi:mandelate racemase/muconate lactonizing enzyme family protein [Brevibacterium yomogidense]|uniref:mandelate racemase/muconate lactonizing enzyme family protein n=1 Tax=Brevibacterium yomogidense TaxID=946573 RepID=UPI0018DF83C4|nr:mandelate racemase/muconate lactonizing enzyme family protein [Brevibacterium yomogidense]
MLIITSVQPLHINRFLYVKVTTDDGLVGYGESGAWGFQEATAEVVRSFAGYLVGEDPRRITHHWEYMYRAFHFRGAAIMGALSAIDIALWDLAGKRLSVPVYELLGGASRDSVRVYKHVTGQNLPELIDDCTAAATGGYTAVGHLSPFLDSDRTRPLTSTGTRYVRDAAYNLRQIAEATDGEIDLCVELHRRLTPAEAVRFSDQVAECDPLFLEDPIRPDNFDAMASVAERSRIPIATGERLHTVEEFQMLLARAPIAYTRISVCLAGGITGAMRIAAVAHSVGSLVVPHNPLSPLSTAACLQVALAVPNLGLMEMPDHDRMPATALYTASGDGRQDVSQRDIVIGTPEADAGYVPRPVTAGLGARVDESVANGFPPQRVAILTRLRADGSVVDE